MRNRGRLVTFDRGVPLAVVAAEDARFFQHGGFDWKELRHAREQDRILELYVNVVEFGPGIFGAEAAARHHYGVSAADLSRREAAGLAAVLPAPLRRRPQDMGWYVEIIEARIGQLGW